MELVLFPGADYGNWNAENRRISLCSRYTYVRMEPGHVLAHELAHARLGHNRQGRKTYDVQTHAEELAASLLALMWQESRDALTGYAEALKTYGVSLPYLSLHWGCDWLGVPQYEKRRRWLLW